MGRRHTPDRSVNTVKRASGRAAAAKRLTRGAPSPRWRLA